MCSAGSNYTDGPVKLLAIPCYLANLGIYANDRQMNLELSFRIHSLTIAVSYPTY